MSLAVFKGVGKVKSIGETVKFDSGVILLNIEIEIQYSNQILPFYITQTNKTPHAFQLIRKHFGKYNPCQIDEEIEFDFNIINKDGKIKLKICSIYNRNSHGLEDKAKKSE